MLDFERETRIISRDDLPRRHHVPRGRRPVRASYDAAQTHAGNERHWSQADGLSPTAALSPPVRGILRNRARYEIGNNSYAQGIVETLANDTVGTGPRLQLHSGRDAVDDFIEDEFAAWMHAVNLPAKLRTMKMAQVGDGEAFGLMGTNPELEHEVKLDLSLIEADQIAHPWGVSPSGRHEVDGIVFDRFGNPRVYLMLPIHPGDLLQYSLDDPVPIAARDMIHLFKVRRPGQKRGLPEITPALPLFSMLRRFTLAVLQSSESAANWAGVIQTDAPAGEEGYDPDPLDTFEMVRGMFTTLPDGWKMAQLKAEQPTTTYGDFKEQILNEIARCLNMPRNVGLGDSSGYNYSSGRLDHQTYFKSIWIDQHHIGHVVMDHIFRKWLEEAALIENYLPQAMRQRFVSLPRHEWFWDGFEHVDPAKEASADNVRLANGSLTFPDYWARKGADWKAKQREQAEALGLSLTNYQALLRQKLLGEAGVSDRVEVNEEVERED